MNLNPFSKQATPRRVQDIEIDQVLQDRKKTASQPKGKKMPPKTVVKKTTTTKPAAPKGTTGSKPAASKATGATKQAGKATGSSKSEIKPAVEKQVEAAPVKPAIQVDNMAIKQVAGVLTPNPKQNWCKSGKWPFLLDPSTRASTFLRYQDTNLLQAVSPAEMDSERIRKALLGGLRYGKPMVIDMGEIDRFDMVTSQVNKVQDELMNKILDKSILEYEQFKSLVKDEDGEEYRQHNFMGGMADKFVFIVTMNGEVPPPDAGDKMYYILVQ